MHSRGGRRAAAGFRRRTGKPSGAADGGTVADLLLDSWAVLRFLEGSTAAGCPVEDLR